MSLNRGLTNGTVVAAGGNDTLVAALTVSGSSIAAGAGNDSISVSVLSNSTISGASGADTITIAGNLLRPSSMAIRMPTACWWVEHQLVARSLAARAMTS